MAVSFACALGHAPGITAWVDAAPKQQKDRLYSAFDELSRRLTAARVDTLVVFTAEHWANFFLDHMSAFCIGRAAQFTGPIEPWLKIGQRQLPGDASLANAIIEACYEAGIEPSFAHDLKLDHGTMIPLHFLAPQSQVAIVPIILNTLAPPYPTARRCMELGRIVGEVARRSPRRIGLVATGGMSHDPGERNHGAIDSEFDRRFLAQMARGDLQSLREYTSADLAAAGAGALELLSWIALAGALQTFSGSVIAYEAVQPWATGIGVMAFETR